MAPQARPAASSRRTASPTPSYAQGIARRARIRRIAVVVALAIVVVGLAIGAGYLAFRATVGGEFTLKDSDAQQALTAPKAGEPAYVLVTAELGSVAAPLDNGGPDVVLLARLDESNRKLTLIDLPATLQITSDNQSENLSSVANKGDAALVNAIETYAKVELAHIVKVDEAGLRDMIDKLGGIDVDVDQIIDDPHAGSSYLSAGMQTLGSKEALAYLRATNLKYGVEDQLAHQLEFASALIEKVFSRQGSFATRLESIGACFQTDYSLADLEKVNSWLGGVNAADILRTTAPGYFTPVTNVTGSGGERYVSTSADMAALIDDLDNGRTPSSSSLRDGGRAEAGSFVVDVQNGTTIDGAASTVANLLREQGFSVGDVGNAEQPIYEETLVVYHSGAEGLAQANAVIDAVGVGRAVEASSYYTFAHDVLLIVGADNKPVS